MFWNGDGICDNLKLLSDWKCMYNNITLYRFWGETFAYVHENVEKQKRKDNNEFSNRINVRG